MSKFTLPALPKKKKGSHDYVCEEDTTFPGAWERKVTLPINKGILDSCKIGEEQTFTVVGRVSELRDEQREKGKKDRKQVEVELLSVEVPSTNIYTEMSKEDD